MSAAPAAPTLLVAGTASHVGKTTVVAGLARILADRGVDVAPFKAQNMSNNARAVPKATTDGAGEIGIAQFMQAKAARSHPSTDLNPVLLKPRGDAESQLVLNGDAITHADARTYYDEHWSTARQQAVDAWHRLSESHEAIIAEGAGSIAEINFHEQDLANIETARFSDASILLVADIERGGVFGSLLGTIELLPADLRDQVIGAVITKFRGDRTLLSPGLETIEQRTGVPVLGVLPYEDPELPEEDSLALPGMDERVCYGADDGIEHGVTVAVPRLPRISNFTDLEPLARVPGVRVSYRPLTAEFDDATAIVLPGSKNTVDDALAIREAGLHHRLAAFDGPIVGLCGGYQLLGKRITNASIESTDDHTVIQGLGFLPVETRFHTDKQVRSTTLQLHGSGPLASAQGRVSGYEIHAGRTHAIGDVHLPFSRLPSAETSAGAAELGAATEHVLGTYLHGLFENRIARDAFVETLFDSVKRSRPTTEADSRTPYDRVAALLREYVDLAPLLTALAIE